ncbi:hypothetical protein BKA70DRAFT_1416169 [Coprinopsis sp. MPI-PUGE-AT-0042]|nr:hypothetical protein BKA70DRAFT_1416169 [Coprinopsis sp. MPI-PUGE-AT-0042]
MRGPPLTVFSYLRSVDVWGHVVNFVDPRDIISIRMTCHALYELSQRPSIWMQAARNACWDNSLLSSSFPFEKMSMGDLEHLALSPHRFCKIISENHWATRAPVQTRIFIPRASRSEGTLPIDTVHLLPGGRYLVTGTDNKGLYLWDLGLNADVRPCFLPIAHAAVTADFGIHGVIPTEDRAGVRIVCSLDEQSNLNPDGSQYSLRIYEIYPGLASPHFNCTKTTKLRHNYKALAVSKDYIALTLEDGSSKTLHVYNVSQQPPSSPTWTECEWGTTKELDSLAIFGTTIVASDSVGVHVFELPTPGQALATTAIVNAPKLTVRRPVGNRPLGFLHTSDWIIPNQQHLLCLVHPAENGDISEENTSLHLFRMEALQPTPNSPLPSYLPVASGAAFSVTGSPSITVSFPNVYRGGSLWRTSNHFFLMGPTTSQALVAVKWEVPDSPNPGPRLPTPKRIFLTHDEQLDTEGMQRDSVSMCFGTGRLVVANPLAQDDEPRCEEIRIIDYLAPASFY